MIDCMLHVGKHSLAEGEGVCGVSGCCFTGVVDGLGPRTCALKLADGAHTFG